MSSAPIINSLRDLIQDEDRVGAVISMSYSNAVIVTNDYDQSRVGGIPQHGFLLAAVNEGHETQEVVLLSVLEPADLVSGRALTAVREDLAIKNKSGDEQTRAMLQDIAFSCKILGTFYRGKSGEILFGSDIDRVRGNSLFTVYRPRGRALSLVASYGRALNHAATQGQLLDIGYARFSDTQNNLDHEARVFVNVDDFIGTKTALFAKTRGGKSNTIKILVQSIFEYGKRQGKPIPQLIFDPQGEYANANSQDDASAIAELGDETQISIYKIMEQASSPKEKHLQFNLFAASNLPLTWDMLLTELSSGVSAGSNYISDLYNIQFPETAPTNKQERAHYNRRRLGVYALMSLAGMSGYLDNLFVNVGEENVAWAMETLSQNDVQPSGKNKAELKVLTADGAYSLLTLLQPNSDRLTSSWQYDFSKGDLKVFWDQIIAIKEQGRSGVRAAIQRIRPLHNASANSDIRENVWQDILAGKIIVVDLSKGSPKVAQTLSEVVVKHIIGKASDRFTANLEPVPLQLLVEEAHNLFERDAKGDELIDPWVRISKEAAKYKIGLIYATQEITSVDQRILSNTSNWIIAHLNSRVETRELGRYYNFQDWEAHILRSESPGFVRMKTASSPNIIPVQIDRFSPTAKAMATFTASEATTPPTPALAKRLDDADLDVAEDFGDDSDDPTPF